VTGKHLPPDHSRGDADTIGGYAAVHARPAAFEGPDGLSYSVELMTDTTGDAARPWGGYLLFMRWARRGDQRVEGHVESDFLAFAPTEAEARAALGALELGEVRAVLWDLVRTNSKTERKWWDVMRDESV
jgi:hypothetical protein